MGSPFDLDRHITEWLDDAAPTRAPDGLLHRVLAESASKGRRPRWIIPERWLPMSLFLRPVAVARTAAMFATLILSLVLAVAAAIASQPSPGPGPVIDGLLVFDSGGDIWLAEPDGSSPRRLTDDPRLERSPVWSPDGTRLAYDRDEADGTTSLVIVDPDGSDPTTIPRRGTGAFAQEWSPDGTRILFARQVDGREQIIVADTNGSGEAPIGDTTLRMLDPVYSPDGTSIAFRGTDQAWPGALYVMDADGTRIRPLAQVDALGRGLELPDWAPDSRSLTTYAMTAANTSYEIWVIPADGSPARAVTNNGWNDYWPTWSADGRIAFVRGDGAAEAVVIDPATGSEAILDSPRLDVRPLVWAPSGTRLLADAADGSGLLVLDPVNVAAPIAVPATGPDWGGGWQPIRP